MKTVKSYIPTLVFIVGLMLAAGLVYTLLWTRFSSGDTYPSYSSLRADPMGTRALFEAIQDSADLTAARALEPFDPLAASPHTRLYAGLNLKQLSDWKLKEVQAWVTTGGQLVLAFNGQVPRGLAGYRRPKNPRAAEAKKETSDTDKKAAIDTPPMSDSPVHEDHPSQPVEEDRQSPVIGEKVHERQPVKTWGSLLASLGCEPAVSEKYGDLKPSKALLEADMELPRRIRWRSPLIFNVTTGRGSAAIETDYSGNTMASPPAPALDQADIPGNAWLSVYHTCSGTCVLEKKMGRGKIIVLGESYLLSNEAMRGDRHADFLLWLMGKNHHIVFDETHFGVRKQAGVGVLFRRYRLQGVLIALVLTGILFVWRNSHSLVEARPGDENAPAIRVISDGYLTLIRRGVAPKQLPVEWVEAWERSRPDKALNDEARITEAKQMARLYDPKNPMAVFKKITRVLTDKKRI